MLGFTKPVLHCQAPRGASENHILWNIEYILLRLNYSGFTVVSNWRKMMLGICEDVNCLFRLNLWFSWSFLFLVNCTCGCYGQKSPCRCCHLIAAIYCHSSMILYKHHTEGSMLAPYWCLPNQSDKLERDWNATLMSIFDTLAP